MVSTRPYYYGGLGWGSASRAHRHYIAANSLLGLNAPVLLQSLVSDNSLSYRYAGYSSSVMASQLILHILGK